MPSVQDFLRKQTQRLEPGYVRKLVAYVLDSSVDELLKNPETNLCAEVIAKIETLIVRMEQGEPFSRIVGYRDFWKHRFQIGSETLDPRHDSEVLVEQVLARIQRQDVKSPRILDLGTGSGCLLLSLLTEIPGAFGVGVDISHEALHVAQENAKNIGVDDRCCLVQGNWTDALTGGFDVIVANPPYISEAEFAELDTNVREFDPYRALVSGKTGLESYQYILGNLSKVASESACVAFEFGWKQQEILLKMCTKALDHIECYDDIEGRNRLLVGRFHN